MCMYIFVHLHGCICTNEGVDFRGHEEPNRGGSRSEEQRIVVRFPGNHIVVEIVVYIWVMLFDCIITLQ